MSGTAEPSGANRSSSLRPSFDHCSIAGTLEALGDEWSVLVLRELFFGVRRFNEIQHDLGISRSVLTERLARLVDAGVVKVVPYREPGQRERHEYRLTRAGVGLLPAMIALMHWGDQHINGGTGPIELRHRDSGEAVEVQLRTTSGRPVAPDEIVPVVR
jgi:DNA-binding HxlR family transcriptional regulator